MIVIKSCCKSKTVVYQLYLNIDISKLGEKQIIVSSKSLFLYIYVNYFAQHVNFENAGVFTKILYTCLYSLRYLPDQN